MDSKPAAAPKSAAEEALPLQLSGSVSLPIRAPPSCDSDTDIVAKVDNSSTFVDDKSSSSVSSSGSSNGSEASFVSGDEEFETASERPFVGDPDEETLEKAMEDGEDTPFLELSESPPYGLLVGNPAMPIAKVSEEDDDDDEEDGVESPKLRVAEEMEEYGHVGSGELKSGSRLEESRESVGVEDEEKEVSVELGSVKDANSYGRKERDAVEVVGSNDADVVVENLKDAMKGDDNVVKFDGGVERNVGAAEDVGNMDVDVAFENSKLDADVVNSNGQEEGNVAAVAKEVVAEDKGDIDIYEAIDNLKPDGPDVVVVHSDSQEERNVAAVDMPEVAPRVIEDTDVAESFENSKFDNGVTPEVEGMLKLKTEEVQGLKLKTDEAQEEQKDKIVDGNKPSGDLAAGATGSNILNLGEVVVGEIEESNGSAENDGPIVDSKEQDIESAQIKNDAEKQGDSLILGVDANSNNPEEKLDISSVGKDDESSVLLNGAVEDDKGEAKMDEFDDKDVVFFGSSQGGGSAVEDKRNHLPDSEGSVTDGETEIFGSSEAARQFLEELDRETGANSHAGGESSVEHVERLDGQIVTDSDEEVDTDEDDGKPLFDSDALAALLKAAANVQSDGGNVTLTSQDGSKLFSLERPAGLGSSMRSLRPTPQPNRPNIFASSILAAGGGSEDSLSEEEKNKLQKIQEIRVKFLRLVERLGYSPEDTIVQQVLYRMALSTGRQTSQAYSLDAARRAAVQLEAEKKDDLNLSLNILALGKTGVGKSATINSIFGEEKAVINAFEPATAAVKEIVGTVDGVEIKVFDTPGLRSSAMEQGLNRRALSSIKKYTKSSPPDIVLYVDRLDSQTRDLNDLPLLKSITSSFGLSIWRSAIVTLTHAASAPPDGPSGTPMNYETFVAQRSHAVQQSIGQAVGDLRVMNPNLMNPVTLVENHPSCRKNREGEKVLPNGQTWRPQLLLLCYSIKILSEVNALSKSQDLFDHRKLFGFRVRSPHLPYLLSWLLQSRTHPKLSADQGGENGDSDIDLDDISDSDHEDDEDEYDQLPPFKPLRKSQIAKLSREQKKAYLEEYDYRVKLLQKKQWRDEIRRMKDMKKGKTATDDYGYGGEDFDQENGTPAAVPVPLPDMALPPSFDSDNPAYRYRFLEPTSQFVARPVMDTHGWDHDCGYDGVNLEQSLAIVGRFPATIVAQIAKDKNEFTIHLDSSVSAKHGESGSSMLGFDIQNVGKQLAYIVRGETKFKSWKKNKATAGMSVTFLGENVVPGVKIEDQVALGKRLVLVGSAGTVRSQGDAAYGANLEVRLRESDYPIGQDQSTLGLSLVKWRGDLALGANLQSQFSMGRSSKIAARVALNNKLSGQITVRTSSSEHLQIGLLGILPIAMAIYKNIWPGVRENYVTY